MHGNPGQMKFIITCSGCIEGLFNATDHISVHEKPPAEVTLGGGVGDAHGAEGLEIDGTVALQFPSLSTAERIASRRRNRRQGQLLGRVSRLAQDHSESDLEQVGLPCHWQPAHIQFVPLFPGRLAGHPEGFC